jgi:hypothetical protein
MVDLPDGSVLVSDSNGNLWEYRPGTGLLAAAVPTIQTISPNADGSFTLQGIGLNGISAGAAYGDDAQMDSNFPLVRLTSSNAKHVYYATTYNWSNTGVQTGQATETVDFKTPLKLAAGKYSVSAVTNGVASSPVSLTIPTSVSKRPTISHARATMQSSSEAALSVSIPSVSSDASLTYTWSAVSRPKGTPLPSFSANGSTTAQSTIVTFYAAGSYEFQIVATNPSGVFATAAVGISIKQDATSIAIGGTTAATKTKNAPPPTQVVPSLIAGETESLSSTVEDQFGNGLRRQPKKISWQLLSGNGSVKESKATVTYVSGTSGLATIQATADGLSGQTEIGTVGSPWTGSTELGSPTPLGTAYSSGSTLTISAGGYIGRDTDRGHYVFQALSQPDGSITTDVSYTQAPSGLEEAGLMIRYTAPQSTDGSLDREGAMIDIVFNGADEVQMRHRSQPDIASTNADSVSAAANNGSIMLQLSWTTDTSTNTETITGSYYDTATNSWVAFPNSINVPGWSNAIIGPYVASRNDASLSTAVFSSTAITNT